MGFDETSLNTSDGNRANTTNLVHILEGKTEGFFNRTLRGFNGIDCLQKSLASSLGLGFGVFFHPTLVPWAVAGLIDHVVAVEPRDRNERNGHRVEADLLDEAGGFLDDLVTTLFRPRRSSSVHLIEGNDELLDTEGVGEKSVLASLAVLGDSSFEFTSTGGDDKDSAVSLRGTSDHVLDEVTVTRGVCSKPSVIVPTQKMFSGELYQ